MSTQEYIRSMTDTIQNDLPTLTPLPEGSLTTGSTTSSSFMDYFKNISWQMWIIIVLILALLGINVFVYLAKGTEASASAFNELFAPVLKVFGYTTLETTKQTVETSATGAKAGVDIVAGTTTGAINKVLNNGSTTGTSVGVSTGNMNVPQGQQANSSLPVQNRIQEAGSNVDQWQKDSLEAALSDAAQSASQVNPDDSRSSIQTTGKSGWCYIGEDQGIRTCAEIGVNDGCMSGDVFPNQAICMNPNLRA